MPAFSRTIKVDIDWVDEAAFEIHGTLDDNVNVDSMGNPVGTPCGHRDSLASGWRSYSILIPTNNDLTKVKDFFKATFIYNQPPGNIAGQGGTVYFDQIKYTP